MQRSPFRCSGSIRSLRCFTAALLLLLAPAAARALGNGKLQIHHMDVGQGDGMLLISPLGQTALFDDGNYLDCTNVKAYLQGLGITTVDYHFCSHYHSDHLGCIDDLAAIGITIGTTGYDRGYSYSSASYTSYVNTLGAKRVTIAKGQTITLDAGAANPVTIACVDLNGAGVYSVNGSDENAKSVALRITYGAFDEEVSGDLTGDPASGNDVETTVGPEVGDIEVYKVHHHGSRYSTNDNWLNNVTPEVAVISCGDGNSYGHPTVDCLTRLHNHGVKTYWTETGAGATPDPAWDKVAHGAIVIEAMPGTSDSYTVTGPGFSDSYPNGGGSPPVILTDTVYPGSVTVTVGTVTGGSAASLAADDGSALVVAAARPGNKYTTDWYGSAALAHPPTRLTLTYNGSFSANRTQTLWVWNWSSGAWTQVDQATVGTTDVTRTWTTATPAAYVSPAGEVRARVSGSLNRSAYSCRADYMAVTYDYQQGTGITMAISDYRVERDREAEARSAPQVVLNRVEAVPGVEGVRLTWSANRHDHLDGFNVYRVTRDGRREHVPGEALIETTSDEAVFSLLDRDAERGNGTYWLGARSCSGPEGLVGPIAVTAAAAPASVALVSAPNPARAASCLSFTLDREAQVRLEIYDVAGRRIATPFAGKAAPGTTRVDWALTRADGTRTPAGVYFARLEGLGRTLYSRLTVLEP